MKIINNPRVRLFIGAALISLSPVWVSLVDVAPSTSGFYRVLFGGAALVIYLLVTRRRLELSGRAWRLLVLASLFLALDLWFWHRSILYIGPGLATLLANFQVFIMLIAGIIFLRQVPRPVQLIAVPMAFLGLAIIVGLDWRTLPADYKSGVLLGLLTAAAYAAYLLTLRLIHETSSFRVPSREVAVISVFCAAMMAIAVLSEGESLAINSYEDFGWLVAYGILSHCLGWLFIVSSLSEVSAVDAGLALLFQPVLSFIWDVLFFGRQITTIELVGAGIALVAIYLGSRPPSKKAQGAG